MKHTFQLTAVAFAVAAVSGIAFAAPVTSQLTQTATDADLGNNYQQTIGNETIDAAAGTYVSNRDIATGAIVSTTTPVVNGPEVQVGGVNYRNYSYQEIRKGRLEARNDKNTASTVNGTTTNSSSYDTTEATGQATRTANTRIELDKSINPATEIAGTKERLDDTTFTFAADDVNTVIGANTTSEKGSSENVTYAAADERTSSNKNSVVNSNLTTKAKLGADGKPVAGQVIRVGTVENLFNEDNAYYKSTVNASTTKVTSKNANGILSSEARNTSDHTVLENYQTNGAGDVVAFNLSTNKKSIDESTVDTNKSASSDKNVNYDDVNAAGLDFTTESKFSNDDSKESLLDGFVAVDKSALETTTTQYNQAALGTSNALDNITTSKTSTENKTRDFVKNAAGEIVLTNAKPTVNTEVMETETSEKYDSVYQPTRFAAANADRGIVKGDAYNQHILNNGFPTLFTDENVAKSTEKGTSSKVTTHKQDNNFQTWEKSTVDNSSTYARNQQENIEVNRDILKSNTTDSKYLSKISGVSVVKEAQESNFKIGTVAVDVDGKLFTSADIQTWKDETGKDRYYVVIDQDANGNDIRSEVTLKDGKPLETKAAELQTVVTNITSDKRTDKVTMSEEVAYQTNDKSTSDYKETSKDGSIVYNADKTSYDTNVKVFSVGKNALHREAVETNSTETVKTAFDRLNGDIIFKDGKPVVLTVKSDKTASSVNDRLFQEGQDKVSENISTSSYEGNTKDAAGVVFTTNNGKDNSTTVNYAAGKELAKTIVTDKADEVTLKAVTANVGFNYDGTAKANIGSNTLREDGSVSSGLAVSNAKVGSIIVDAKSNTSNKEDTKTYQDGGVKAYESTTAKTNVQSVTYADGTTGTVANNSDSTTALFNKGKADKYREAVVTTANENTGKTYKTDADGDITLADGKPVEMGVSSDKVSVKTTENLYQIGQERKTDIIVATDSAKKSSNVDGSAIDDAEKSTSETITYRVGQKDGKESETNTTISSELKVSNADQTGYNYQVNAKSSDVTNATKQYLLATRDVKSVSKGEWTETLAANGKNTVSITRGTMGENRTDASNTNTVYGSETITAADDSKTMLSKKETYVNDKFGTTESETLNRTETTIAKDGSSSAMSTTRVDTVDGVTLTKEKIVQPAGGKDATSTVVASTEIKAGEIKVGDVVLSADKGLDAGQRAVTGVGKGVADTDAVNVSQMNESRAQANSYTDGRVNQVSRKLDNVERTAYRGVAIALAAQQAVPNIQPGQVAVFGGVGHYEGETAGSIGVVTSFTDRISASGAFGFAGSSSFGGRVGISYLFGGN